MPFPLGLYLNIEHNLDWVLFCVAGRLYLEATTERCCLKYVSLKLGKADTLDKDMNTLQW